jgi:hypothetical protein
MTNNLAHLNQSLVDVSSKLGIQIQNTDILTVEDIISDNFNNALNEVYNLKSYDLHKGVYHVLAENKAAIKPEKYWFAELFMIIFFNYDYHAWASLQGNAQAGPANSQVNPRTNGQRNLQSARSQAAPANGQVNPQAAQPQAARSQAAPANGQVNPQAAQPQAAQPQAAPANGQVNPQAAQPQAAPANGQGSPQAAVPANSQGKPRSLTLTDKLPPIRPETAKQNGNKALQEELAGQTQTPQTFKQVVNPRRSNGNMKNPGNEVQVRFGLVQGLPPPAPPSARPKAAPPAPPSARPKAAPPEPSAAPPLKPSDPPPAAPFPAWSENQEPPKPSANPPAGSVAREQGIPQAIPVPWANKREREEREREERERELPKSRQLTRTTSARNDTLRGRNLPPLQLRRTTSARKSDTNRPPRMGGGSPNQTIFETLAVYPHHFQGNVVTFAITDNSKYKDQTSIDKLVCDLQAYIKNIISVCKRQSKPLTCDLKEVRRYKLERDASGNIISIQLR